MFMELGNQRLNRRVRVMFVSKTTKKRVVVDALSPEMLAMANAAVGEFMARFPEQTWYIADGVFANEKFGAVIYDVRRLTAIDAMEESVNDT